MTRAPRLVTPAEAAGSRVGTLVRDFERVRAELEVPDAFPSAVLEEATAAAERPVALDGRVDLRDVPFVTIDPPGSRDLDQAVHLERDGDGFRVRYAIADVGAFVAARRRDRGGGLAPWRHVLQPRRAPAALSAGARGGCRQPARRPGPTGGRVHAPSRRRRRAA
jgi:hypothetical protein